jgi:tetratricopeptide (TPR) repeat protein
MNFFKKLFGAADQPPAAAPTPEQAGFEQEFLATVPRYLSTPRAQVDIQARHPQTGAPVSFAEAYPEQFATWSGVHSLADRRGIIYGILDDVIGSQIELWQVIERFIDDRYPERALSLAVNNLDLANLKVPNYWVARARANFVLTHYAEAEANLTQALELDRQHLRAKVGLADVYHLTSRQDQAHALYSEVLEAKLPGNQAINLPIKQLVGFEGDILPSPIYAAAWLRADQATTAETWQWAGEEFYYSPHFRAQHAYHLIGAKEHLKGFVKLLNLAKEMPWYKEAVLNSYSLMDQLHLGSQMAEEKARLEVLMQANHWHMDDLPAYTI